MYSSDHCDNKATFINLLKFPKQSRHEGILSDCDQLCNKAAGKEILEKTRAIQTRGDQVKV